ncbi:hypothetical protein BG003_005217, partial [Podila horticola]
MPELEILLQETEASSNIISNMYRSWNRPDFLRLTSVEKGLGVEIRNIASFGIWTEQMLRKAIICLYCDVDRVSGRSWDATLLEASVRRFPTVLKSLTLDIT